MAQKGPQDLTREEGILLIIAARLYAALKEWADRPRAQARLAEWERNVGRELVRHTF